MERSAIRDRYIHARRRRADRPTPDYTTAKMRSFHPGYGRRTTGYGYIVTTKYSSSTLTGNVSAT
jgi:hypothetical protein